MGRDNETPLPVAGRVFTDEALSQLERLYADDLDRFGRLRDFQRTLTKDPRWTEAEFRDREKFMAADLARSRAEGKALRREMSTLEARTARLSTQNTALHARVADLEQELSRRTVL